MAIFKPDVPHIYLNAEHQRLMWLNFSPALIAGLILVYGFFCFLGFDSVQFLNQPEDFYHHVAMVGRFGYGFSLLALLILLKNSIQQDLKSQFWDQLRMSSLSAWQMTWTRLFTAPMMAWLSLIIASLLLTVASALEYGEEMTFSSIATFSMCLLFAILFACTCLINCLQFGRSQKEWQGNFLQLVLFYFVMTLCLQSLPSALHQQFGHPLSLIDKNISADALIGFVVIMVTYVTIGAWRSMSYKLHLKSSQTYWLIATFALPFALSVYHLIWGGHLSSLLFYMSLIYISTVIFSLSIQDNRLSTFKLALQYMQQKQWKNALLKLPLWVHFLVLCFLLIPIYALLLPDDIWDYLETLFMLFAYAFAVLCAVQVSHRFNAITIAMIGFLIFRSSLFLFQ